MATMDPMLFYFLFAAEAVVLLLIIILVFGSYHQIALLEREFRSGKPRPSRLQKGDRLPFDKALPLPPHAIVLFLKHGCSGCVDICRKLEELNLPGWSLITIVSGPRTNGEFSADARPLAPGSPPDELPLPTWAHHAYDPEYAWLTDLNLRGTPTALAFADGRLVAQELGPNVAWFTELAGKKTSSREELPRLIGV